MNIALLLMAQYSGKAIIPIDEVCRDYFLHLTPTKLIRKISAGEIAGAYCGGWPTTRANGPMLELRQIQKERLSPRQFLLRGNPRRRDSTRPTSLRMADRRLLLQLNWMP
mgnify:CR=1 FL=1